MVKQHYKGRDHKERVQPRKRRGLGFLEKHKDYVKRAKSYHENSAIVKDLQKAAFQKNPDEYAFGMIRTEVDEDGFHVIREPSQKGPQIKKDNRVNHGYLQMQYMVDRKKVEKLRNSLAGLRQAGKHGKRTLFFDSVDEAVEQIKQDPEKLTRHPAVTESSLSLSEKWRLNQIEEAQYKELEERTKRSQMVKGLTDFLEEENKLMTKGKRKAFRRKNGTVYFKWDAVRKK
eukprot:RCo045086